MKKNKIRITVYRLNEYTTQYRYFDVSYNSPRLFIGMCETFLDRKTWYAG